jgi:hypothetical protein
MHTRALARHTAKVALEGGLIAILSVGLLAGPALAGKTAGGGAHKTPSGGTLSIKMVTDTNGNGAPNFADQVAWDVSKTTVTNPYVTTTCTQGGVTVLTTWAGYYPGYLWPGAQIITLSSDVWTGGPATCTGVLYGTSTTFTFSVGG